MRPFKNLHDQLHILHKRGLKITNYKKAKHYLLSNNYYQTVNGYSKYFMLSNNVYNPEATFDEITKLKLFDQKLREALLAGITMAENHFNAILAYYYAEHYQQNPEAYLDINNYYDSKAERTIFNIEKAINANMISQSDNPIKHYKRRHQYIPIWVIIHELEFGTTRHIFKYCKHEIRNKVSDCLLSFIDNSFHISEKLPANTVDSFLRNINELRNACAHNKRLLEFKCRGDHTYFKPLHEPYNISNVNLRRDVYNIFIILQLFINDIEHAQLHNTLIDSFRDLDHSLHSIDINVILQTLGFEDDWHIHNDKLSQSDIALI